MYEKMILNERVKMGIMCQGSIIYPYREMQEVYVVLTYHHNVHSRDTNARGHPPKDLKSSRAHCPDMGENVLSNMS